MEKLIIEKFIVINKVFLDTKDIAVLLDCGVSKARVYRHEFLKSKNYKEDYFKSNVPTGDFVKYFKINLDIIRDNYKVVKQLGDKYVN